MVSPKDPDGDPMRLKQPPKGLDPLLVSNLTDFVAIGRNDPCRCYFKRASCNHSSCNLSLNEH